MNLWEDTIQFSAPQASALLGFSNPFSWVLSPSSQGPRSPKSLNPLSQPLLGTPCSILGVIIWVTRTQPQDCI